ncbi:MAG: diacylglycerol/lipid kinase family protein [Gammaproteobacteria bacterium]
MARLGIITNYQAGRNRKRPERIRALVRASGATALDVTDLDSIRAATRQLAEEGVNILAINGGDGTVHAVLTRLLRRDAPLPLIAVVPGGTTNLTANDLSRVKSPERALENLARLASLPDEQISKVQRRLLAVTVGDSLPQYGFFLGAGAVLRGMEHFRDNVGARGFRGELAAGFSMVRGIAGIARGRQAWTDTHLADVRFGHDEIWHKDRMLVVATTMHRLLLGIKPWWSEKEGPVHLTALRRKPDALLRLAPSLLRGQAHRLMTPEHGYRSGNVSCFDLRSTTGFALDGELFPLATNEFARVRATAAIDFLDLGNR